MSFNLGYTMETGDAAVRKLLARLEQQRLELAKYQSELVRAASPDIGLIMKVQAEIDTTNGRLLAGRRKVRENSIRADAEALASARAAMATVKGWTDRWAEQSRKVTEWGDEVKKRGEEIAAFGTSAGKVLGVSTEKTAALKQAATDMVKPWAEWPLKKLQSGLDSLHMHPLWHRAVEGGLSAVFTVSAATTAAVDQVTLGMAKVNAVRERARTAMEFGTQFRARFRGDRSEETNTVAGQWGERFANTRKKARDVNSSLRRGIRSAMKNATPARIAMRTRHTATRAWRGAKAGASAGKDLAMGGFTRAGHAIRSAGGHVRAFSASVRTAITTLRGMTLAQIGSSIATRTMTAVTRILNLTLLANPLAWIAVAIAASAFLVYKYWQPISGFFRGLWAGFKEGIAPLMPAVNSLSSSFKPVTSAIQAVVGWFRKLIKPVEDTDGAANKLGVRWGKALGGVVVSVARLAGVWFGFLGRVMRAVAAAGAWIGSAFAGAARVAVAAGGWIVGALAPVVSVVRFVGGLIGTAFAAGARVAVAAGGWIVRALGPVMRTASAVGAWIAGLFGGASRAGGTAGSRLGQAFAAAGRVVSAVGGWISNAFGAVARTVGGVARRIGSALSGALRGVSAVLGAVMPYFRLYLRALSLPFIAVWQGLRVVGALLELVGAIVGLMVRTIVEAAQYLWRVLDVGRRVAGGVSAGMKLFGQAAEWVGGRFRAMSAVVMGYVTPGIQLLGRAAATVGGWLRGVGEVVGGFLGARLRDAGRLLGWLGGHFRAAGQVVGGYFGARLRDLGRLVEWVGGWIRTGGRMVGDFFVARFRDLLRVVASAREGLRALGQVVGQWLAPHLARARQWARAFGAALRTAARWVADGMRWIRGGVQVALAALGRLRDRGAAAVREFVGKLRSMIDGALTFLRGIGPSFLKIGNDIIDQIVAGITGGADRAVEAIRKLADRIRNFSFFKAGQETNNQLAAGMRASAHVPVRQTANQNEVIRQHYPESPAKRGPLRNLHRLKWGETIAMGIRAEPMVAAMRRAAAATMAAVTTGTATAPLAFAQGPRVTVASPAGARSPIQLAVHVHLPAGSGGDAAEQARRGALAATPELVRMIERTIDEHAHRRARISHQRAG